MSAQLIEFEVYPEAEGDEAREDQVDSAERLRRIEPEPDVRVVNKREGDQGILPVVPIIIIAGVLGAISLGKWIEDLLCHHRRKGMILDATGAKLKIKKDRDLPGGTLIVIGKDGAAQQINACDMGVEFGALVSALNAGHSAPEAVDKAKDAGKEKDSKDTAGQVGHSGGSGSPGGGSGGDSSNEEVSA